MKKRIISVLLAAMMALSCGVVSVSAKETINTQEISTYSETNQTENVLAIIDIEQANADLLTLISESGIVLGNDDVITCCTAK